MANDDAGCGKPPMHLTYGRQVLQGSRAFDAAGYAYKLSGYLIGWKNQQTVGMQKEYVQGYPQEQMLEAVKQAHSVQIWATLAED